MLFSLRSSMSVVISLVAFLTVIGGFMIAASSGNLFHAKAAGTHMHIDCTKSAICTEVLDPEQVFGEGKYVGHDEPSTLFYSNVAGSGNNMRYELTLPNDPPPVPAPGRTFNFQLHPAFWFGMAMCDTQSYPEQVSTCTPDSDSNIVDPAVSPNHPGTAFMEMQFYPPGWIPWPAGNSCDATKWCAALNIDSLSEDPVNGTQLNPTCAAVTGLEYVNFAFITKSGTPQPNSPPNPVESTLDTFTPNPNADLFMNSGDRLEVTLQDTTDGLRIDINDLSSGKSGSMTTSAANGFGGVKFAPSPLTECVNVPFNFHPMYSTSSELTRVPWAAHSYNIAFTDETGHFEACNGENKITPGGNCPNGNREFDGERTDANDANCYPAASSTLVQVRGCFEFNGNTGFDSLPYHHVWPDGNPNHPTSILFTSPLTAGTGQMFNTNYDRMAFEADLPRIEFGVPNPCIRRGPNVGTNCTLIPQTDDGTPADFYPFFSIGNNNGQCTWMLGEDPSGTTNDFGKHTQFGAPLQLSFTGLGGTPIQLLEDFRQILANPCNA